MSVWLIFNHLIGWLFSNLRKINQASREYGIKSRYIESIAHEFLLISGIILSVQLSWSLRRMETRIFIEVIRIAVVYNLLLEFQLISSFFSISRLNPIHSIPIFFFSHKCKCILLIFAIETYKWYDSEYHPLELPGAKSCIW